MSAISPARSERTAYRPDLRLPDAPHAVLGLDDRIASMNAAALQALGFSDADDLTGLAVTSLWPPAERDRVREALTLTRHGIDDRVAMTFDYLDAPAGLEAAMTAWDDGTIVMTLMPPPDAVRRL